MRSRFKVLQLYPVKKGTCANNATVLLQAMKEDPPFDAKCRDKFLVQSVAITADRELSNVAAIVSLTHREVNF